jgi:hypothetical protein
MRPLPVLSMSLVLAFFSTSARSVPLPGTPLSGSFGTIDITEPPEVAVADPASHPFEVVPGTTELPTFSLPGPVTEGDLILQEPPVGDVPVASDVVRFTNVQGPLGNLLGEATLFSNTDDVHGGFGLGALPGGPLANQQFVTELVDPTIYEVPGASYRVFSDAEVPEPSTLLLMSSGLAGVSALARRFRT